MHSSSRFATLILLLSLLCSCQTTSSRNPTSPSPIASPTSPSLPTDEYTYGTAIVESVTADPVPAGPTQVKLIIRGLLNDGATTIHQVEQTKTPDGFVITVTTARLKSAMATLALVPFERIVTLDLSSVRSGPCQVRVNDIRTTITVP